MMHEYIGTIHMHSVYSDGSGEVSDIAGFAEEVGLDFAILTDHNTVRALTEGYEKWYGNTLFLVGCEINDKENKNHYLAFGIDEAFSTRLPAKEYVKKVKESGGVGFLAHPHEKRTHMKEYPAYPWVEWGTSDFDGIEIWNHMSEWMENLNEENKYRAFLHPLRTIDAPQKETLEIWDKLNLERKVAGLGGVDAHAHKYNLLGFMEIEIFPYKVLFKSIHTHILTHDKIVKGTSAEAIKKAKWQVYNALKDGRSFIANDYHGDSKGFRFFAESNKKTYQMGDSLALSKTVKLKVNVPLADSDIRLIRNGKIMQTSTGGKTEFIVHEPGAYRIEVMRNKNSWIYSNHIRIGL